MTSCHCPISVICLVCKGEDLTPRYLVLACEPFVTAGAGRETLCALARIAVRLEREQAHEWCMQCDMRVAHTCSRLSSVLAVLCTAFFFLRTVPLPPVRTCRAHSAGARTAQCGAAWARAVRGRFESGRAPACAPMGRAQMRGRAGALLAGVHGAGTTIRSHNKRAGGRATRQSENRGLQLRQLFRVHRHLGGRHSQRLLRSSTSRRPRLWEQHELKNPKTYFCGGAREGRFVICDAVGQGREA